jgi:hypothetical protein
MLVRKQFGWTPIEQAPSDIDVRLRVIDEGGSSYVLPVPCRLKDGTWVSSAKETPLKVQPVEWQRFWTIQKKGRISLLKAVPAQ